MGGGGGPGPSDKKYSDSGFLCVLAEVLLGGISKASLQADSWPRSYKTLFMLNSVEHELYPDINIKMPTIVGILTCISMINTIGIFFFFYEQFKFRAQLS